MGRHAESARSLKLKNLKEREEDDWKVLCSVLLMRKGAVLQILCWVLAGQDRLEEPQVLVKSSFGLR